MSMLPMYKRCPSCKRQFSYNPSVGDLGFVCPHCKKAVIKSVVNEGKDVLNSIKKIQNKYK